LLVAILVAWTEMGRIPDTTVLLWLLIFAAVTIGRLFLMLAYRRQPPELAAAHHRDWQRLFVLGAALSGAVWGAAGIFLFPLNDVAQHFIVPLALAGMVAGGVPYLAPSVIAYGAFSVPALLPVIVRLVAHGDTFFVSLGLTTAAYLIAMISVAGRSNRTIVTTLKLQYHNEDLLQHLERTNAQLITEVQERKSAQKRLEESLSLLQATLDSTGEGILVLDFTGQLVSYNRRFLEMWKVPEELLDTRRVDVLLHHIANQLGSSEVFLARVRELYRTKTEDPRDRMVLKDGRVCERLSIPYRIGGEVIGRVWSFRLTADRAATHT
ncbi:MAG TPA: PAS-domain containing protein, partial [Burkholderiales bacterium]|nr:PAS-domain containing protein [Burkholderiales bacterium]